MKTQLTPTEYKNASVAYRNSVFALNSLNESLKSLTSEELQQVTEGMKELLDKASRCKRMAELKQKLEENLAEYVQMGGVVEVVTPAEDVQVEWYDDDKELNVRFK